MLLEYQQYILSGIGRADYDIEAAELIFDHLNEVTGSRYYIFGYHALRTRKRVEDVEILDADLALLKEWVKDYADRKAFVNLRFEYRKLIGRIVEGQFHYLNHLDELDYSKLLDFEVDKALKKEAEK